MSVLTFVSLWALLALLGEAAERFGVEVAWTFTVLGIMVVHAVLVVVRLGIVARHQLEVVDVQVLYGFALPGTVIALVGMRDVCEALAVFLQLEVLLALPVGGAALLHAHWWNRYN